MFRPTRFILLIFSQEQEGAVPSHLFGVNLHLSRDFESLGQIDIKHWPFLIPVSFGT